ADLREPAPAAAVVADQVVPLVVEEGVVVVCGGGRPARRRRLGVAEGLPERLELRRGNLSHERRDREPAAGVFGASLSDLRAHLEEAPQLDGRERVAARRFLVARGRVPEWFGIARRR